MPIVIECDPDLSKPEWLLEESTPKAAAERILHSRVEACSEVAGSVLATDHHAFMAALHTAFVDHRPFVLSPDMIWLLIAQGFANHVSAHANEMRGHFVSHEGRKSLVVRRDDFIKGSPENPWENVFAEFSSHIREEIGATNHDRIVARFSTTGPVENAANEVVLMETMAPYFSYVLQTRCGIPAVRLEGCPEDWTSLVVKAEELGKAYGIQWWTDSMRPVLETMATHSKGKGDPAFWRDIYKQNHGSGGPYINGWILNFFPYFAGVCGRSGFWRSGYFGRDRDDEDGLGFLYHGITTGLIPSSLSTVPFVWNYFEEEHAMEFVAGFTCFTQEAESLSIRPKIGWAVRATASNAEPWVGSRTRNPSFVSDF
jgi:hypothetical protein